VETCIVEEPFLVKQLSLNNVCKIGLTLQCQINIYGKRELVDMGASWIKVEWEGTTYFQNG
jgi:hypothetical protein